MQRAVTLILAAIGVIIIQISWHAWSSRPGTVSVQSYRDGFSFSPMRFDDELDIRAIGEEPKELRQTASFNGWRFLQCIPKDSQQSIWEKRICALDGAENNQYLLPPHRYEVRLGATGKVIVCRGKDEECRTCSITQPWDMSEITVKPGEHLTLNISDEAIAQAEKCFREPRKDVRYAPGTAEVTFEVFTNPCSDECGECSECRECPNQSQ